jgi:hypothetical protein
MERLAYGRASGIRWKKGVAKDLNQILRVLLALISSRLLQAKFKTHLGRLRQEHGEQWKSLWVGNDVSEYGIIWKSRGGSEVGRGSRFNNCQGITKRENAGWQPKEERLFDNQKV